MSTSTIKNRYPKTKSFNVTLNIPANGSANANLKTLIDADMPSGCTCLGVVGFTTNDQSLFPISVRYADTAYSLQIRNTYNGAFSNKKIGITYLYI